MIAGCYDLTDGRQIQSALSELRGFWKFWSACLLQVASLPTLRGIIVTQPYPQLRQDIHRFLQGIEATTALIRHDVRWERPPYPRGGFLVPEAVLSDVLSFFFGANRIVGIYEPADPLLNSYNLNVLFESATDVLAEVIGPGFDASDLQRGDLSPHEVFAIALASSGKVLRIEHLHEVHEREYQKSKELRREKLQRKIKEWPTPNLAHAIQSELMLPGELEKLLGRMQSPLSSDANYIPISEELLVKTVTAIVNSDVIRMFRSGTNVGFPLNFSTSLIDKGKRQVFWDIVSPALKFQGLKR